MRVIAVISASATTIHLHLYFEAFGLNYKIKYGTFNSLAEDFINACDVEKELREQDLNKMNELYLRGHWENLKAAIEKVEKKNVVSLHQWCQDNPDSKVNNTENNLLRDKIFMQTLQGDDKTREKIIKNIAKEVLVEK